MAAVPERVARTFRVVGLDQVFPTHLTAQDAEEAAGFHDDPGLNGAAAA